MFRWLALVSLLAAGCTAEGPSSPAPTPQKPFEAGIELGTSQEMLDHGYPSKSFNFVYLRNLYVRLKVAKMPKMAMANVWFIAPGGERVYETTLPFSPDPSVTEMTMPGVDHPMTVFQAKPESGGYDLDLVVPVLGTVLTRTFRPGAWRVESNLDGQFFSAEMQVSYSQ
jgi:hypothetical protein